MRLSCTEATISLISLTSAETDDGTGETNASIETSARTRQQRWRRNVTKTVRYGEGSLMICGRIKSKF